MVETACTSVQLKWISQFNWFFFLTVVLTNIQMLSHFCILFFKKSNIPFLAKIIKTAQECLIKWFIIVRIIKVYAFYILFGHFWAKKDKKTQFQIKFLVHKITKMLETQFFRYFDGSERVWGSKYIRKVTKFGLFRIIISRSIEIFSVDGRVYAPRTGVGLEYF